MGQILMRQSIIWQEMLNAGESVTLPQDGIMICASEDVGNADPQALVMAVNGISGGGARRHAGGADHSGAGSDL